MHSCGLKPLLCLRKETAAAELYLGHLGYKLLSILNVRIEVSHLMLSSVKKSVQSVEK